MIDYLPKIRMQVAKYVAGPECTYRMPMLGNQNKWAFFFFRVAQDTVLMCQKSKSSNFLLIFRFQMKIYPIDSNFSSIGDHLGVAKVIFVFTKELL